MRRPRWEEHHSKLIQGPLVFESPIPLSLQRPRLEIEDILYYISVYCISVCSFIHFIHQDRQTRSQKRFARMDGHAVEKN